MTHYNVSRSAQVVVDHIHPTGRRTLQRPPPVPLHRTQRLDRLIFRHENYICRTSQHKSNTQEIRRVGVSNSHY